MGTRSLTFVHDNTDAAEPIVCIYQQYDGYFHGVGDRLLDFLRGSEVVNGISLRDGKTIFNGSGDLAARLITYYKGGDPNDAGGVYIESPNLSDGDMGTEFAYHIYPTVGEEPRIVATDVYASFTIEGLASEIEWPEQDSDGNYIVDEPVDPRGPLTAEQRRALFANFTEVFGHSEPETRYAFTRMVLGLVPSATVSWSDHKEGTITASMASMVLDALDALNV